MAEIFHIDPATVWDGDEHDIAVRIATSQLIARARQELIDKATPSG